MAVAGAGIAGLAVSLTLARRGHDVVLYEQDAAPPPPSPGDWQRPGVPQFQLPHGFVAGFRRRALELFPDVVAAALDRGARELDFTRLAPDGPPDPGLVAIACRRSLLEWCFRRAVEAQPGLEVRAGEPFASERPSDVDLIVDAAGRRSRISGFPSRRRECGIIYYTRYFELDAAAGPPQGPWFFGPSAEGEYLSCVIHQADNGFFSATFGTPPWDRELKLLRDERAWDAAAACAAPFAQWIDPERARPATGVLMMGGLQNVIVDVPHGSAEVVAVGDARCHTNAAYGWGAWLALEHAAALAQALDEESSSTAVAAHYEERIAPEAEARWTASSGLDDARSRRWRVEPPADDDWTVVRGRMLPRLQSDPEAFRLYTRFALGLDPAADVVEYAKTLPEPEAVPALPSPVPPRVELLARMEAATAA